MNIVICPHYGHSEVHVRNTVSIGCLFGENPRTIQKKIDDGEVKSSTFIYAIS